MRVRVHAVVTATGLKVPHEAETQGPAAVLVTLELGNGGIRSLGAVEADNTSAARSSAGLILDFRLLDLPNRGKQVDKILVARGPRELRTVRNRTEGGQVASAELTFFT